MKGVFKFLSGGSEFNFEMFVGFIVFMFYGDLMFIFFRVFGREDFFRGIYVYCIVFEILSFSFSYYFVESVIVVVCNLYFNLKWLFKINFLVIYLVFNVVIRIFIFY